MKWEPDLLVVVRKDLCRAPDQVAELSTRAEVAGAVIPSCAERAGLGHVLKRAGALPWAIETIDLPKIAGTTCEKHDIPPQLAAAVARVRSLLRATPAHLKVSSGPRGDTFDRRAFLRSLLEPTYQVVPAVETSRCAAPQGCRLCLAACPPIPVLAQGEAPAGEQDLSLPDILIRLATAFRRSPPVIAGEDVPFGQVRVEGTVACTLCGVCAQICPTQALGLTHTSTEEALTFKHAACVACGSCVEHCPEHVLRLERALDINQLSGPVQVLARERVHRCQRCQQVIASASMLAKVQQVLRSRAGMAPWDAQELCASCRLARSMRINAHASLTDSGRVAMKPDSSAGHRAGASGWEVEG